MWRYTFSPPCAFVACRRGNFTFFGPFTKVRKASVAFVISVCPSIRPSVRMGQRGSHRADFREICYLCIFRKFVNEIEVY
jgi:hypothetical protein